MIRLDTNVVSEPLRAAPDARVIEWIDAQPLKRFFCRPSPLPNCARALRYCPRAGAAPACTKAWRRGCCRCSGRVLPFDLACTQAYAALMATARAARLAIASADGYIAAIAAANGLAVATRDTGPFKAAGTAVIDSWQP